MTETWIAVALAVVALVGTIAEKINARKANKDKAEQDRLTARDKMEFDSKLQALEAAQKACEEGHADCKEKTERIEDELTKCHNQHQETGEQLTELRKAVIALQTKQ